MESVRRTNDNDVGTFVMLKYICDETNDVLRFCNERHQLFWGIFIFIIGVPPSYFVAVSFLLTSLRKDDFLRRRL